MRPWGPPLSLLGVALVVFAVPSRYEVFVLIPISPGHGLSPVDLAAMVPLIAALAMVARALIENRQRLERTIQQAPWPAASALFTGGTGLGLLFASVFPFFWWWAVGAALLTVTLLLAVLAAAGRCGARGPRGKAAESGCHRLRAHRVSTRDHGGDHPGSERGFPWRRRA